jgi:hypothetical protein
MEAIWLGNEDRPHFREGDGVFCLQKETVGFAELLMSNVREQEAGVNLLERF